MPLPAWVRRARRHFGISAPRMAVRTHLSWRWRTAFVVALVGIVAGMWWWGFDFGQILGGFNRKETEERLASLENEAVRLRAETAQLRARNVRLESELAMTQGAQATLTKQAGELQTENTQLKEELVFLQQLVADANKQVGLSIQRIAVDRVADDAYRYHLIVVRGGSPTGDFRGSLTLQVTLQPPAADGVAARPIVTTVPDDQPDAAPPLRLDFKYYQRVEGSFRVPPGALVRSLTVRAFEAGHGSPRATRSLNLS